MLKILFFRHLTSVFMRVSGGHFGGLVILSVLSCVKIGTAKCRIRYKSAKIPLGQTDLFCFGSPGMVTKSIFLLKNMVFFLVKNRF